MSLYEKHFDKDTKFRFSYLTLFETNIRILVAYRLFMSPYEDRDEFANEYEIAL